MWILGSLLILAHCSDETGARTLQDVLEGVCGRPGLIVCSTAVALYCFGTCITFLIIIGDQFDRGNENHPTCLYQISSKFTCEKKKIVNTDMTSTFICFILFILSLLNYYFSLPMLQV